MTQNTVRRHRVLMVALFFLMTSLYMITYSGSLLVNDELQMLDTTGSIADFADVRYDVAMWYVWTNYGAIGGDDPLPQSPIEPVQSLLALPFYLFAKAIDGIGLAHAAWLVNVLICAAACVVFFRYALLLGYHEFAALSASVALGLCTVLWPYSRTFLREPATTLFLLSTAYCLENFRRGRRIYVIGAVVAFGLAFFTKESALMALPAFLLFLLTPVLQGIFKDKKAYLWLDFGLILLLMLPLALIYTDIAQRLLSEPLFVTPLYAIQTDYLRVALHSYLLSVGGSIWGTSPIVLLAVPGGWMLLRQGTRSHVWLAVVCLLGFVLGHAFTTGVFWFGGIAWPPRFIIPALPFLMLLTLPVFDRLAKSRFWQVIVGLLVVYSLWWQVNAAAFSWFDYAPLLPDESFGLSEWLPGLNVICYMRPAMLMQVWFNQPLDVAWVREGVLWWPLIFGMIALASLILMLRPVYWKWYLALPALFISVMVFSLATLYEDTSYLGDRAKLHEVVDILDEQEQDGDVLLLNTPQYHRYFVNYGKFDHIRVVSLPLAPGERGSFEETPAVISEDLARLLLPYTPELIDGLTRSTDRFWVLMDTGPFLPWSIRPLERYLTSRYYLVDEIALEPTIRLLQFDTTNAQYAELEAAIAQETSIQFDEGIDLIGFFIPKGQHYVAGDYLPISLYWRTEQTIEQAYNVALFLAQDGHVTFVDGVPVQGEDSAPAAGFAPTTEWQVDKMVVDNRLIQIPPNMPPGEYQILLRLYTTDRGEIETLPILEGESLPDDLLVLPVTIIVQG